MVRKIILTLIAVALTACATPSKRETYEAIDAELGRAAQAYAKPAAPDAVSAALLPPIQIDIPTATRPLEERFSVSFNDVPAPQFFMAIVSGTPYTMLVHPDVQGSISANLKDVTVLEALDAIREMYGFDFRVEGNRITVRPASMQTQVFQVNYLTGNRRGTSEIRVTSTSVSDVSSSGQTGSGSNNNNNTNNANQSGTGSQTSTARDSSKISTSSDSDFWGELRAALNAIVGTREGRSVVISPQSGVVVIRAMPDELRNVSVFLKATQLSVSRQVILEAKILEVQLNDAYQTGINWAAFRGASSGPVSAGMLSPGTALGPLGAGSTPGTLTSFGNTGLSAVPGSAIGALATAGGSLFGLAFQTSNFAALISFLESQGNVHVISSPRIATLNNQKAVLKIGTDEFFVTNVSTTTTAVGTSSTTSPSVTLQPFFSGVVLDVTPQIDQHGNIILHVRPSVSQVETVNKSIDLGTAGGSLLLPLAASNTSETDSIVRGRDGQIVAIGGLMRQSTRSDRSQIPGAGDVPGLGSLFRNTNQVTQKRELVILLKPTIVQDDSAWTQDILDSQQRIQGLAPREKTLRW